MTKSAIIIGAGIVGLATARALSLKGFKVTVIERSGKAVGASVRNFGMIWPLANRRECCITVLFAAGMYGKKLPVKAGFGTTNVAACIWHIMKMNGRYYRN